MKDAAPRALLLISGGFDSAVAGRVALDSGLFVCAVHFSAEPFTDGAPEKKAGAACRKLGIHTLHLVPVGKMLEAFANSCERRHYFVLMKRLFLRLACHIAQEERCAFLLMGDNLAQVSSQTLPNLATVTLAADRPVLRPLLCADKQEIVDLAKKFGLHDISVGAEQCDVLGPAHPSTQTPARTAEREETKIEYESFLKDALSRVRIIPLCENRLIENKRKGE